MTRRVETMRGTVLALMLSLTLSSLSSGQNAADSLFQAGKFAEAEKLYAKTVAEDATNYQAVARLGHLALLGNRLDEAARWLTKAIASRPDDKTVQAQLAEVYYRRDDFRRAAPLLAATGKQAKAKKLESFSQTVPYQIDGQAQVTHLKFVHTDPLPLVRVKINGSEEVNFLIDTGERVWRNSNSQPPQRNRSSSLSGW